MASKGSELLISRDNSEVVILKAGVLDALYLEESGVVVYDNVVGCDVVYVGQVSATGNDTGMISGTLDWIMESLHFCLQ